ARHCTQWSRSCPAASRGASGPAPAPLATTAAAPEAPAALRSWKGWLASSERSEATSRALVGRQSATRCGEALSQWRIAPTLSEAPRSVKAHRRLGSLVGLAGERLEHGLGVRLGVRDALPVFLHAAVRADPHRRADHALRLLAVHRLLAEGLVAGHHLLVRVAEQREGKLVLRGEVPVARRLVGRHADHDRAARLDLLPEVAEPAGLLGAARRVVSRVEVEDQVLAGVV